MLIAIRFDEQMTQKSTPTPPSPLPARLTETDMGSLVAGAHRRKRPTPPLVEAAAFLAFVVLLVTVG